MKRIYPPGHMEYWHKDHKPPYQQDFYNHGGVLKYIAPKTKGGFDVYLYEDGYFGRISGCVNLKGYIVFAEWSAETSEYCGSDIVTNRKEFDLVRIPAP